MSWWPESSTKFSQQRHEVVFDTDWRDWNPDQVLLIAAGILPSKRLAGRRVGTTAAGGRMNIMKLAKLTNGCAPIAVEQIGMALGKTPQQIQRLRQEAVELNRLDEIFTPA